MRRNSDLVLKAFLDRCPPDKKRALERFLPQAERLRLPELPSFLPSEETAEWGQRDLLEYIHWSWLLPLLKTYSDREQKFFLSSLSPVTAQNLSQSLDLSDFQVDLTESARLFLRDRLLQSLIGQEAPLIPIDYLPESTLRPLLGLSKKELTHLIDLLALHDLASELRHIVDTKTLKKISSLLTEEQKKFLKQITPQKEPFPPPRMGLERWDGTEEGFHVLLHRRGLTRFGLALSKQDPDFVWYICHQLDSGRGTSLQKLCAKETTPDVAEAVVRQIEEIVANPDLHL